MSNEVKFKYGTDASYKERLTNEGVDASALYFVSKDIETEDGVDFGGTIYRGNDALGTTCADHLKTTAEIKVVGLPDSVKFAGYQNGDTIPAGTSLQEFLVRLLSKELYPKTPTKPSIDIEGEKSLGTFEAGTEVDIPAVSMTKSAGKFNADYASPAQPTPSVTWSNEKLSATVSGFGGVTVSDGTTSIATFKATVANGSNTITWRADASYSAPANSPLTNLSTETTKLSENDTTNGAVWAAGSASKTNVQTKATGVYPAYYGIIDTATPDASTVKGLTKKVSSKTDLVVSGPIANKRACVATPPGWNITSVLDPNNFENVGSFPATTIDIVCLDGTTQTYNLYVGPVTEQDDKFKYTFK